MSGVSQFPVVPPGAFLNPGLPEVFANQLRIGATFSDFTLVFGTTDSAGIPGQAATTVRDRIAVHVAPGMLKQLLLHIQMVVDAYETAIGSIPIPAGSAEALEAHRKALIANLRQHMTGTPVA